MNPNNLAHEFLTNTAYWIKRTMALSKKNKELRKNLEYYQKFLEKLIVKNFIPQKENMKKYFKKKNMIQ